MKSTPIFKILGLAVLAAIVLYFTVQGANYFSDTMRQTEVYESFSEDTITLNGWLIREEEVFTSAAGTLDHSQSEGAKVGVGQPIAVVYQNSGALATVDRMEALQLRLEQLDFARSSFLDKDAVLKLDSTIESDLVSLCQNVSDGDYGAMSGDLTSLKAAVMKRDHNYLSEEAIEEAITEVKGELSSLRASLSGAATITTERAGIYSANCDGYESVLTPAFLEDVTPAKMKKLAPIPNNTTVGKMIYGDTWYYAAVISDAEAEALGKRGHVTFRFAKGLNMDVEMTVEKLTKSENGHSVLVLSCDRYLSETTLLRNQSADLILRTYTGLRVNANALRVNEEGESGVYCVIGATARFKPVTVVYEGDGYVLVKPQEGLTGTTMLRPGDQAITSAGDLFDGKVIS